MRKLLGLFFLAASFLPMSAAPVERYDPNTALTRIQTVFIEKLGGGETSDQMRDMLISALHNSRLFTITENQERADAILRGSSDDNTFTDEHHSSETLGVHTQNGSSQTGRSTKSYMGAGLTDNESSSSRERRHEATASVRLVNLNGDVIWSTTQESSGGKFRGAMADIADRIVRRLTDDIEKARKTVPPSPDRTN